LVYVCCDCVGCIVGDEVDGVPGIQHLVPSFGRKTALKLIKKHGTLETLLNAAAIRTVGRPYAQDALKNHADYLRRNYEVLALRRCVGFLSKTSFTSMSVVLFSQFVFIYLYNLLHGNKLYIGAGMPRFFPFYPPFTKYGSQFLTGM